MTQPDLSRSFACCSIQASPPKPHQSNHRSESPFAQSHRGTLKCLTNKRKQSPIAEQKLPHYDTIPLRDNASLPKHKTKRTAQTTFTEIDEINVFEAYAVCGLKIYKFCTRCCPVYGYDCTSWCRKINAIFACACVDVCDERVVDAIEQQVCSFVDSDSRRSRSLTRAYFPQHTAHSHLHMVRHPNMRNVIGGHVVVLWVWRLRCSDIHLAKWCGTCVWCDDEPAWWFYGDH